MYNQDIMSSYSADCIVNIDQTNIDFDVESYTTLESFGSKTVNIKTRSSSDRCNFILGVTHSGWKLKAFAIFKGQLGVRSRII